MNILPDANVTNSKEHERATRRFFSATELLRAAPWWRGERWEKMRSYGTTTPTKEQYGMVPYHNNSNEISKQGLHPELFALLNSSSLVYNNSSRKALINNNSARKQCSNNPSRHSTKQSTALTAFRKKCLALARVVALPNNRRIRTRLLLIEHTLRTPP